MASRADLDLRAARLDDLSMSHSGVREPSCTYEAMLRFRDPDSSQLEFFWRAAPR